MAPTATSVALTEPRAAFSLLEVLLAIAILGVVALVLATLGQGSLRIRALQEADARALAQRHDLLTLQLANEPVETPPLRLEFRRPESLP